MSALLDPLVVKLVSEINTPYTSCYCEENIYLACQRLLESASQCLQDIYVVFISNETQTASTYRLLKILLIDIVGMRASDRQVLLWEQRASQYPPGSGQPVVWDYHVIMILVAAVGDTNGPSPPLADRTYVVDFDSSLGTLTSWKEYTSRTFRPEYFADGTFETRLQSMFRVVSAPRLIDQFASDRSHMIGEVVEGVVQYKMPPPPYEPIVGPGAKARGVMNGFLELNWLHDSTHVL